MPGPAVQIRGATASNHSNQVYDNVISGAGLAIQSDGDFGSGNDGTVIENNTIYASASNSNGIHLTHTNTNTVVKNNIVSVGAADAFNVAAASETGLVSNYNLFRNTSGNLIIWGTNNYTLAQFASYQSASSQDANSLTSDPLFTSTSDFHLLAGSPAINAGTNVSLTSDYAGTSVPQGPAPDIGAYEYIQNTAPTVSISLPSSSGNITVTATASATSPAAISSVQFYLDGSPLNSALAAAPYSTTLNTASLSNGTHTLYAVATDNYGNTATSQSASFNVNNGGGGGIVGSGPLAPGYVNTNPQPTTVATTPATTAVPTTQSTPTAPSTNATPLSLTKNHSLWDTGADIKTLQQWLNTNGFTIATTGAGSLGNETSTFGNATYKTLIKFQKSKGLPQTGYLGPMTRAAIANF